MRIQLISSVAMIPVLASALCSAAAAAPVSYKGSQSTVQYNLPYVSGGVNWTGTQYIYGTKVIYDSATGTYTLRDTGSTSITSTFTAANITSSTTDYTTYSKSSGGMTETFKVLNPGNTLIPLTYVRYGKWRRTGISGNYFKNNDTYVVFGTPTPSTQMPHSGSASYTTLYDGTWINSNGLYSVGGTGTIDADFLHNSLTFGATLSGTKESDSSVISFGSFSGTGSISTYGPTFSGSTATYNSNGYALKINGGFYGTGTDAASEVGGNFSLTGNRSHYGSGTGAFVGKKI
jgi:hypothetical protein